MILICSPCSLATSNCNLILFSFVLHLFSISFCILFVWIPICLLNSCSLEMDPYFWILSTVPRLRNFKNYHSQTKHNFFEAFFKQVLCNMNVIFVFLTAERDSRSWGQGLKGWDNIDFVWKIRSGFYINYTLIYLYFFLLWENCQNLLHVLKNMKK